MPTKIPDVTRDIHFRLILSHEHDNEARLIWQIHENITSDSYISSIS